MRHFSTAVGAVALMAAGLATPASAATPKDTLVIAWNLDNLYTFDPAQIGEVNSDEFMGNVCDSLLTTAYDDPSKLQPHLAESWTRSPDGLTYTIAYDTKREEVLVSN